MMAYDQDIVTMLGDLPVAIRHGEDDGDPYIEIGYADGSSGQLIMRIDEWGAFVRQVDALWDAMQALMEAR